MSRYLLGADASIDLNQIGDYIAEDDIDTADRWLAKRFAAFESLSRNPCMGHRRTDLTDLPVLSGPSPLT